MGINDIFKYHLDGSFTCGHCGHESDMEIKHKENHNILVEKSFIELVSCAHYGCRTETPMQITIFDNGKFMEVKVLNTITNKLFVFSMSTNNGESLVKHPEEE